MENFAKSGINFINDIICNKGLAMECHIALKIQMNDSIKYLLQGKSLISSIPKRWKDILQEAQSIVKLKENCDILIVDGVRPIKSIESKNFYQAMIREKFVAPTSDRKFEILFKKFADKLEQCIHTYLSNN